MSGINSLSGLNKVNVDFRPTIEPDVPKTANANQPQPVEVVNLDDEQQPPRRSFRRSSPSSTTASPGARTSPLRCRPPRLWAG